MKIGAYSGDMQWDKTKIFEKNNTGGYLKSMIPKNHPTKEQYPSALEVYKDVFEDCIVNGDKVTIVSIGFLTNLKSVLWEAEHQANSGITYEMITKSVEKLFIMGGAYPEPIGLKHQYYILHTYYIYLYFLAPTLPEYNFGFNSSIPWVTENDVRIRGLSTAYVMEFWHKNG